MKKWSKNNSITQDDVQGAPSYSESTERDVEENVHLEDNPTSPTFCLLNAMGQRSSSPIPSSHRLSSGFSVGAHSLFYSLPGETNCVASCLESPLNSTVQRSWNARSCDISCEHLAGPSDSDILNVHSSSYYGLEKPLFRSESDFNESYFGAIGGAVASDRDFCCSSDVNESSCTCGNSSFIDRGYAPNSSSYISSDSSSPLPPPPPPVVVAPTRLLNQPLRTSAHITSVSNCASCLSCTHWCTSCRLRLQVEVECVPESRTPASQRRNSRMLSFPKRVRLKLKPSPKDTTSASKKKKSPWMFKLNCKLRKEDSDNEGVGGSSSGAQVGTSIGCTSCMCPSYRRREAEMYTHHAHSHQCRSQFNNSLCEGNSSSVNSFSVSSPVDFNSYNRDSYASSEFELGILREREDSESLEPPNEFAVTSYKSPVHSPFHNVPSLPLPLSYNSMIDLHLGFIIQRSLRLGFPTTIPDETMMRQLSCLQQPVHTQVDYTHCLVPDLLAITNGGFYWGKMDRYEAERLLDNKSEGTFLLRDSAQEEYLFSVTFRRYGRSLHARIEHCGHKFSFDSHDPGVFAASTVCSLIEHYKDPSSCMFFEPLLTIPLIRTFPFPLQHLCRAVICSHLTYDDISHLKLPKSLKCYLREYHYKHQLRVRRWEH